jgi:outer membrane receptor protein involved in Fe transport
MLFSLSRLEGSVAFAVLLGIAAAGRSAVGATPVATGDIDEITVTATLRDDVTVRRLPSSVAVLDRTTVEEAAVQHFEELAVQVPNLNYSGDGSRARYFQVRGVGELEQYEGVPNPSVGFIIDDIDFSALGGIATTFDTGRVEVLRGPQGTRYGANALGGLIYVQSVAPTGTFDARAEATAGGDGASGVGLAVGGPLPGDSDELSCRVAMHHYGDDGFRHNAVLGSDETNERDELTTRGRLRWKPNADWQVDLTGLYVDLDNGYDAWAIDNSFTTLSDEPGRDTQRTSAGALRVTGALNDAVTLVSITGVADSDVDFGFDGDWGNAGSWAPYVYAFTEDNERERRTLNQELRLMSAPAGRIGGLADWLAGIYVLDLDESNLRAVQGIYDDPADGFDAFAQDFSVDSDYDATSVALFGEVSLPLDAATRLSLGLRGERRDANYDDVRNDVLAATATATSFSPDDHLWGGELALTRDVDDAATLFGRVARGYRGSGFNPSLAGYPGVTDGQLTYGDEHLWSYEAGLRIGNPGRQWWADLTAFWQERSQMQVRVPVQLVAGDPTSFVFLTDNAQSGRAVGAEAALGWRTARMLTLNAGLGLLDTEVRRFAAEPQFEDRPFPHAPAWSATAGVLVEPGGGWFARLDVFGRDNFYFDYDLSSGAERKSRDAWVANLRAGREWRRWRVEVWARNLFDEEYAVRGFYFGNEPPAFAPTRYIRYGDQRQAGVTLSWRL